MEILKDFTIPETTELLLLQVIAGLLLLQLFFQLCKFISYRIIGHKHIYLITYQIEGKVGYRAESRKGHLYLPINLRSPLNKKDMDDLVDIINESATDIWPECSNSNVIITGMKRV